MTMNHHHAHHHHAHHSNQHDNQTSTTIEPTDHNNETNEANTTWQR